MKPHTRKQAIDAFCKQCIYDPYSGDGNWRQQVTNCTASACALFEHRPRSKPRQSKGAVDPALAEKMRNLRETTEKRSVREPHRDGLLIPGDVES